MGTIIIYIIGAVDMQSQAGGITICGGPSWRDSTTLDVATIQDTKFIIQAVRKIDSGYRLPPPPGCPKAVY